MRTWLAVPLAALIGCSGATGNDDGLERARGLWASKQISSYEIVLTRVCNCAQTAAVRVEVVANQIVARTLVSSGQPVAASIAAGYPDVPGLFAIAEDAYRNAHSVAVTFDATYGYPVSMVIDYIGTAVDDEVALHASGFVAH